MAVVQVDPTKVDHVLPDRFWGLNFSVGYWSQDLLQGQYQQLIKDVSPEVWRTHDFRRSNGALYTGFDTAKKFMLEVLPGSDAILNPDSGPANLPSTDSPCAPLNLATNGTGRSPADHAALLDEWLAAGVRVRLVEPYNELWGHCTPDKPFWYGGTRLDVDGFKCETWGSVHQRDFWKAYQPVIAKHNAPTKVGGHVFATSEGYGFSWTQSFIDADAIKAACTSPYKTPGGNLPYFDDYVFHGYPGNPDGTLQGRLNSLLTDASSAPPNNGTSLFTKLIDTRKRLDAAGGQGKGITIDEAGLNDITSMGALFDAVYAVIVSRYQKRFGISRFLYHSANTGSTSSPQYPLFTTSDHKTFAPTVRSCVLRDIVSPFLRGYKRHCAMTVTGSGSTPGKYPSPRIQVSNGLNAAGDAIAVKIVNADLTNAEPTTVELLSLGPGGAATVTYMRQGQAPGATPKKTLTPSGGRFSLPMEPGSVYLIEIPLQAATPPPQQDSLPVTIVDRTSLTVTLGWTPPAGVTGYVLYRNGKRVSNSWDPAKATWRATADAGDVFEVRALNVAASGTATA